MNGIKQTGIFATEEELKGIMLMAQRGWMPGEPLFVLCGSEWETKGNATHSAKEYCHAIALSHGLPEIEGFYGIDKSGEFISF